MDLEASKKSWDEMGRTDPVSAMLAWDAKGRITDVDDLFAFGRRETQELISYVESLNIKVERRRALDFGCGMGRSAQALANYFDEVDGVDIAPSLVELADKYNRHGARCKYSLNQRDDLTLYGDDSFDFILCYGTLQVVTPRHFERYMKEFFRTLKPGGLLVLQHATGPSKGLRGWVVRLVPGVVMNRYRRRRYGFEVYAMKRRNVVRLVESIGGKVVDVKDDRRTIGSNWIGAQYCILKAANAGTGYADGRDA